MASAKKNSTTPLEELINFKIMVWFDFNWRALISYKLAIYCISCPIVLFDC